MQTPKTSTKNSSGSEGGRRISPRSVSSSSDRSSGRVVRQLKTTRIEPNSFLTSQPSARTPRTTSPKIVDRASPKAPVTEKNRLGRIAELETQVSQLEDALRRVKDQLIVSESWKKQAKIDAEESRKELLAMSLRLEESQKLLDRPSSHDPRDEQVDDSTTLAAALVEIDQLKVKLRTTSESEAAKTKKAESTETEINILKENMKEMKKQLEDCKISESQAQALATETLQQLETAKKNMESFSLNSNAYNAMVFELEQSRARVRTLEQIVDEMKKAHQERETDIRLHEEQCSQTIELIAELKKSKEDIEELKANLMDKETELQCVVEENENLSTKLANLIVGVQENELKTEVKGLKSTVMNLEQEVKGLKSTLMSLETELCEKSDENKKLEMEIKRVTSLETGLREKFDENEKLKLEIHKVKSVMEESTQDFNGLKSKLMIQEKELCEKSDENEKLKLEIKKMGGATESVKLSNRDLEEELRKLKLQMSQWRKAAEVATAMLCDENNDNNGRTVEERTWSTGHYSPRKKMHISSPCSTEINDNNDNDDDEFEERRNGNMLKRIGVLWKKPQNK